MKHLTAVSWLAFQLGIAVLSLPAHAASAQTVPQSPFTLPSMGGGGGASQCSDLSDAAPSCSTDTTTSANIAIPGADTYCLFRDGTRIGADAGCTYSKATDSLTLGGHVILNANQAYYLLGVGTWRILASNLSGSGPDLMVRDKATGYAIHIQTGNGSDQGTVIGSYADGPSVEFVAGTRLVYFNVWSQHGPQATAPGSCGDSSRGAIYFDNSLGEHCACRGAVGAASWQQMDGGGAC